MKRGITTITLLALVFGSIGCGQKATNVNREAITDDQQEGDIISPENQQLAEDVNSLREEIEGLKQELADSREEKVAAVEPEKEPEAVADLADLSNVCMHCTDAPKAPANPSDWHKGIIIHDEFTW